MPDVTLPDGTIRHEDAQGKVIGWTRPYSAEEQAIQTNRSALDAKLDDAISYFNARGQTSSFAFSALANNAARDAHIRRMNSAIEGLARLVRQRLDSAGD